MALLPTVKKTAVAKPLAPATKPTPANPVAKTAMPLAKPAYTPKETDVAKIAADIAGQDSLLMRQARTEGLKTAHRRGLLASTIAAGAAQGAVVERAGQMAQATAGFNAAENVATADRMSAEKIAADNRALEAKLTRLKLTSEEKQQLRQIAATEGMAKAEIAIRNKLQKMQIAADAKEKRLDRGLQTELAKWNLDAADREKAASMLTSYSSLYEQQLASINSNKDLSAEQRTAQIQSLNARRTAYVQTVRELYDVDISFAKPPAVKPGAKPAAKPGAKPGAKPNTTKPPSTSSSVPPKNPKIGDTFTLTQNGKKYRFTGTGWTYA